MEVIKIIYIILGTFFMREQPGLIAEKATVTVDPIKKEVVIFQENLISATDIKDVKQTEEYRKLAANELNWVKELEPFQNKTLTFEEKDGKINAKLSFNYADPKDLAGIHIGFDKNEFNVFQEEKLSPLTGENRVEEPYLIYGSKTPFSFKVDVFNEWLEPNSQTATFNQEFVNQPLVAKKSDDIKGKSLIQMPSGTQPGTNPAGEALKIFFAEDQDFALINEEIEIEVKYFDNNTVMIPMTEDIGPLKKGDNYFIYKVYNDMNGVGLIPSAKNGKILSKNEIYLAMPTE